MFYKIIEGALVLPTENKVTSEATIFNYNRNTELLEADGFIQATPEEMEMISTGNYKIVDGKLEYCLQVNPEVEIQETLLKYRKQAENEYITFCRGLGVSDVAPTEEIEAKLEELSNSTEDVLAQIKYAKLGLKALALMNEITQLGGNWNMIEWHDDI